MESDRDRSDDRGRPLPLRLQVHGVQHDRVPHGVGRVPVLGSALDILTENNAEEQAGAREPHRPHLPHPAHHDRLPYSTLRRI